MAEERPESVPLHASDRTRRFDTPRSGNAPRSHAPQTMPGPAGMALSPVQHRDPAHQSPLTSREELQSLNEELTALNSQLQESLERQRQASDDLQNVLCSTNIGTLFLDRDLKIRFFTPAVKALFHVIPSDIGRPLADLAAIAPDPALLADPDAGDGTIEHEVPTPGGVWLLRRILPYRTHSGAVEGVVITFADITERKLIDAALEATKHEAERANIAKSRFLAAASHDLRQPLQSLALLRDLLAQSVVGDKPQQLLARFAQTLRAMSGMLNTLLDINQIEAGAVQPRPQAIVVCGLFERLREEFETMTTARGLQLRVLGTTAVINSDPRLLDQMLRNLLGNAIKYTTEGKILLGCRRRGPNLRIEVYDTGIGIVEAELHAIFEEFHQVDNVARERSQGLGLGLAIVQQLARLLGHAIDVRSTPGRGSVFAITVPIAAPNPLTITSLSAALPAHGPRAAPAAATLAVAATAALAPPHPRGRIMVVEDDPDLLDLLDHLLTAEGYQVESASDAAAAIALVAGGAVAPPIVLTDYTLPGGMSGLELLGALRAMLPQALPAIILTGDITAETMAKIAAQDCLLLSKPVDPRALLRAITALLGADHPPPSSPPPADNPRANAPADVPANISANISAAPNGLSGPITYIIDDDPEIRATLHDVLAAQGRAAQAFASAEAFLAAYHPGGEACLLIDAHLPGMSGVALLAALRARGDHVPVIFITGDGDIGLAVAAMRSGACDFIEKPVSSGALLASITRAIDQSHDAWVDDTAHVDAATRVAKLTQRQSEVMRMVVAGHPSKNIAADLGISQRTVENHRAAIMHRLGVASLPELARLVLRAEDAGGHGDEASSLAPAAA